MAKTKETKKMEIEEKEPQTRENYLVIGMSLGMSLGVAVGAMIGAATNQIAIGMCFGVGIGTILGVGLGSILTVMKSKHDKEMKEEKANKKEE